MESNTNRNQRFDWLCSILKILLAFIELAAIIAVLCLILDFEFGTAMYSSITIYSILLLFLFAIFFGFCWLSIPEILLFGWMQFFLLHIFTPSSHLGAPFFHFLLWLLTWHCLMIFTKSTCNRLRHCQNSNAFKAKLKITLAFCLFVVMSIFIFGNILGNILFHFLERNVQVDYCSINFIQPSQLKF